MKKINPELIKLSPQGRLYQLTSPVIGLTGGIASGKSTVTKLLRESGLFVIDADQLVKDIYQDNETIEFVKDKFPDALISNKIDFSILRKIFFKSPEAKKEIEDFIYKRIPDFFLKESQVDRNQNFLIYDVPLLFEKGLDEKVDFIVTVYSSSQTQIERLLKRDGIEKDFAEEILKHQMDIEEKKRKADFVVENQGSLEELAGEVHKLLQRVLK